MIRAIGDAAERAGLTWELDRRGGNHDIYSLDGLKIPIGRHTELDPKLVEKVYKECEPKLGRRWWR